ncbi:MAG: hypothetical protein MI919_35925, partial [Holophagales bacterium]|nr:hypothetical protein [Holophagales bacterium]
MTLSIRRNRTKAPSRVCFALFTLLALCCASASAQATKSQRLTLQAGADKHAFLTEAIFPWAHNAYNSSAYGYTVKVNQDITITAQLNAGQRLIDLDLQYCHGYDDPLRLSHNICGSGDAPFWHRLDEIAAWFAADPERLENEVIILYLEAGLVEMMDIFADPRFDLPIT